MKFDPATQRKLEDRLDRICQVYRDHALEIVRTSATEHDYVDCEVCRIGRILGAETS